MYENMEFYQWNGVNAPFRRMSHAETMEKLLTGNYVHGRRNDGIWFRVSLHNTVEYPEAAESLESRRG